MPLGGAAPQIVPLLPKSGYESCDKIEFASARFTLPHRGKKEVFAYDKHFDFARSSRCRGNNIMCTNLGYAVQATGIGRGFRQGTTESAEAVLNRTLTAQTVEERRELKITFLCEKMQKFGD